MAVWWASALLLGKGRFYGLVVIMIWTVSWCLMLYRNARRHERHRESVSQSVPYKGLRLVRSTGFRIGLLLLGLAAFLFLGLMVTTSWEQAKTPGEKNLGVAALFILWSLPVAFFGLLGTCLLLVSTVVFLYRRFRKRSSDPTQAENAG